MRGFIVSLYAVVDYPFEKRFFEVVSSANFGLNRKRLLELSITFVHKCVQVSKQFYLSEDGTLQKSFRSR